MKVFTSRSAWQGLLRRAKANHPREHVEALWGIQTIDAFRILRFNRIQLNPQKPHDEWGLEYTKKETERQKKLAKAAGLEFLGTVHTHPLEEHDAVPSEDDHLGAIKDGERIMGIVHLYKPKRRNSRFVYTARWWFPQKPVSFEVLPD